MKRLAAILLAVVMTIGLLAGCGGSGQGSAKGDKLQMWITTLGEEADILQRVTEEQWNVEHPDSQIEITVVPGNSDDFYQKLSTAFATGTGPDMFCISNAEILKYVETGIAYPVTDWVKPNASDYVDGVLDSLTFDGDIVAFPGNMDLMALYCNTEYFSDAGLDYPKTWDELITAVNTLSTEDSYGIIMQTDTQSGYQLFEFYPFLWMCGGSVMSDDGKTVTLNSDATAKALEFYKNLLTAPGTCKKVENTNVDITPFGTGRTAMQVCGSWAVTWLAENYPDLEYAVVPYPTPSAGTKSASVIGGWQYMVSSRGADPKEAAEYLNWLWSSDDIAVASETATAGAKISPRLSVLEAESAYYSEYPFDVFTKDILPTAKHEPTYSAAIVKAMGDALQDAVYSSKAISDILADAEKACSK